MNRVGAAVALFALTASACAPAAVVSAVVSVPGMDHAAWPLTIKAAVMRVRGVTNAVIDLDRRQVRITLDDEETTLRDLTRALKTVGYASTVVALRRL